MQLFHLLEFNGQGGESLFVDGFRAAKVLKQEDRTAYMTLSETRIPAHSAGNEDVCIQPWSPSPVFTHDPINKELVQIRWNNDDRSTMDNWSTLEEVPRFYDAIRKWDEILRRKSMELWIPLVPGQPVIFDNWRVLHGRAAFKCACLGTFANESGHRRLCGGYINRDDFVSRLNLTNLPRGMILEGL